MNERFVWKAEIRFNGTAEEFNQLAAAIEKLPVEVSIPEWAHRPHHFAGCMPVPIDILLGREWMGKLIKDMPHVKVRHIKDIYGGIRTAHVHLGDEVVFLDRARFKTLVTDVARELGARRVETVEDYIEVMDAVDRLDPSLRLGR